MASVSTALHVTLSDGSLLHIRRDGSVPTIDEITPSPSLQKTHGDVDPLTLRICRTADSKQVPQFLLGELVSLMKIDVENGGKIELFSGRISKLYRT
ncbi:MAG TPA: hypothetical protein VIM37_02375 [Candidatus Microsaccharimonas sp.]|jgi:hypothetical protein